MPNKKAKDKKRKRAALNKKWATEGRTERQHKKWLVKNRANQPSNPYFRR